MLECLAITADIREDQSGEHGYRVGRLSSMLVMKLGWDQEACRVLDLCARLHDIGKIGVPDRILLSPEKLEAAERHFISAHTLLGSEILSKGGVSQLRVAEDVARCHHEWWDGTGYPRGLSGVRIPIHARVNAVVDVFDALTHGRPYAEPWTIQCALNEIEARSGTQLIRL